MKFEALIEINTPELENSTNVNIEDIDRLRDVVRAEFGWLEQSGIYLLALKEVKDGKTKKDSQAD